MQASAARARRIEARGRSLTSAAAADADGLVTAGLEAHRAGHVAEAAALYAQALRADPGHADALNLGGAAAFAQGRTEEAIRLIGRAIKAAPKHLDAYLNLAEALEKAGRTPAAMEACQKALAVAPDLVDAHARLAWLNAGAGISDRALAYSRVALALDPQSIQALCARALALYRLAKAGEAEATYREALAISPDDLRTLTGLGALLSETDRTDEAEVLFRRALALEPDDPGILAGLGRTLENRRDVAGALALFDRARELCASPAEMLFSRGRCLRDVGRFDEAEAIFRQAAASRSGHAPSLYALARMKRLENSQACLGQLGRLFADQAQPALHRVQAGFAAGEVLDRAGESEAAFRRFAQANALYARTRQAGGERFDRAELRGSIDRIVEGLAGEYARDAQGWGNPSDLPVFVVGMPRSGTTLVEQICASHTQVFGAGEMKRIQFTARLVAERNEGRERIADWDAQYARAQADRILAELEGLGDGALRVVDKSPLNVMRLGLIGALFPNARVIWCRRDLRDVVVSNHTMFFGQGNLYSTDQSDCAYFVRQVERLGGCWTRESKLKILEVSYERLVEDLDGHVRTIMDFLGLEWEPGCLDFYKTDRRVDTPSAWQVRQPVYTNSIGRWRRFEPHLGPMLETLAAAD